MINTAETEPYCAAQGRLPKSAIQKPRECHRCPRNGKGDPYCWERCIGPAEKSDKGISYVRLGGLKAEAEFIESERLEDLNAYCDDENEEVFSNDPGINLDKTTSPECGSIDRRVTRDLSEEVENALVPVIANLMSLQDIQLCILRHVFKGEDLTVIGKSLPVPISRQAVFSHLLRMCRSNKVVEKVIHGMMKKGHGGASRTHKQLDLFEAMGLEM